MTKLNSFSTIATSIAALGGVMIAGFQAYNSNKPPEPKPAISVNQPATAPASGAGTPAPSGPVDPSAAGAGALIQANQPVAATQSQGAAAQQPARSAVTGPMLLSNVKSSLATSLAVIALDPKLKLERSATLLVQSSTAAAKTIDSLQAAIAKKNPKAVADATRLATQSMGRLQSTYALAPIADPRIATAMRSASASWSTYTARFALSQPAKAKTKRPTAKKVMQAKADTRKLRDTVAALERETKKNAALQGQLQQAYNDLDYYDQMQDDSYDNERYQSLLLTLNVVVGILDGIDTVSERYYPDDYRRFKNHRKDRDWMESQWDDYYSDYYRDADWDRYDERFYVPERVGRDIVNMETVVNQDNRVTINQTVNQTTVQNVTLQQINQLSSAATMKAEDAPNVTLSRAAAVLPPGSAPLFVSSAGTEGVALNKSLTTEPPPPVAVAPSSSPTPDVKTDGDAPAVPPVPPANAPTPDAKTDGGAPVPPVPPTNAPAPDAKADGNAPAVPPVPPANAPVPDAKTDGGTPAVPPANAPAPDAKTDGGTPAVPPVPPANAPAPDAKTNGVTPAPALSPGADTPETKPIDNGAAPAAPPAPDAKVTPTEPTPQQAQPVAEPAPQAPPEQPLAEPAPQAQPEQPAAQAAPEQPVAEPAPQAQPEQPAAEPAPQAQPEQPAAQAAPEQPVAEPAPQAPPEQPAAEPAPQAQPEQPAAEPAPQAEPEQPAAEPPPQAQPEPDQPSLEKAPCQDGQDCPQ